MLKQLFYHMPWDNKICPLIPKAPPISGLQAFVWPTPGTTASPDFYMVLPRTGQTAWGAGGGGLTQEVPPLGIQVGLVGKTAFEHISAIVRTGPGTRDSPAMSTVDQLHDGPRTFWGQRYLENKGSLSLPLCTGHQLALREPQCEGLGVQTRTSRLCSNRLWGFPSPGGLRYTF